jgi:hypothetical protein
MRKPNEDAVARTVAENQLGDLLASVSNVYGTDRDGAVVEARALLGGFKTVEFETTTRTVGDETICLRRLVATGSWEVDPSGSGK